MRSLLGRVMSKTDSQLFKLERKLTLLICQGIGSVRALTVYLLVKNGEWQQLIDLKVDPLHYDNHLAFADDYLVSSLLVKNPRVPLNVDRVAVAIEKFRASERKCRETNERFQSIEDGSIPLPPDLTRVLHRAREFIRTILGPLDKKSLTKCAGWMSFGPGATTGCSRVVTQGRKYSQRPLDVTPRLLDFGLFCKPPGWQTLSDLSLKAESKLVTVPKNAKTDRVICIEPDLNIFVQKGIGALLRHRLALAGLDLSTQVNNQNAARRASSDGYCTIDLSAASDTIARAVVWHLLPEDWCDLLHWARVDKTRLPDGEVLDLEKWSSMGNGYTFELETLIFYSVLVACRDVYGSPDDLVLAYGDDLVVKQSYMVETCRALESLGFSVNREKTFGEGRFHESCGADFFDGMNVRPFFFRSESHDFETSVYTYANMLCRWRPRGRFRDKRLYYAWVCCFTAVHPDHRYGVPQHVGDVGFAQNLDRAVPPLRFIKKLKRTAAQYDSRGWGGYTYLYRHIAAETTSAFEDGMYYATLNGNRFLSKSEDLRGRFRSATTKVGYSLEWPDLGPWA